MDKRRMSIEHASRVFRALRGEWNKFPDITFEDALGMDISGETFEEFLELNRAMGIQFYEEAAPVA